MENEPSVEAQWDAYSSGEQAQPEAEVDTDTFPVDEQEAEPTDDAEPPAKPTTDLQSIRAEMNALKQQFEQERTQYQEALRRAQQSFRSVGDSIVERVEQRLAPIAQAYDGLVKEGLLTPEDAQARLNMQERAIRSQEVQRDQQARNQELYQAWLAQQGKNPQQPQTGGVTYDTASIQEAQAEINALLAQAEKAGLTQEDLDAAGVPSDFSHLSPLKAIRALQGWLVAAQRMKLARNGQVPRAASANRQFPFPDMGGGAGVPARGMEGITKELEAEMRKPNPNMERVNELSAALDRYVVPQR